MDIKIKKKKPMPIYQKIFYIISAIFLLGAFIYLGTKDFQGPIRKKSDNLSFALEYGITEQNVFKYKTTKEILEIMNNGSGIIFFGFPENKWSKEYATILNDSALKANIKEINYYNFKGARSSNNHSYNQMVTKLKDFLPILDNGVQNIYAPTLVIVKNKEVIFYDSETSVMTSSITPEEYWTKENINQKEEVLKSMFETYLSLN